MQFVYLLRCDEVGGNRYYIGCTNNIKRRLKEHQLGEVRTTKNRNPKLIYFETFCNSSLAYEREKRLKSSGSVYNALLKRLKLK